MQEKRDKAFMKSFLSSLNQNLQLLMRVMLSTPGIDKPRLLTHVTEEEGIPHAHVLVVDSEIYRVEKIVFITGLFRVMNDDILDMIPGAAINDTTYYRPIAYIDFHQLNEAALLIGLMEVHPDLRRKGIGGALLAGVKEFASTTGSRFIRTDIFEEEWPGASDFFLRRGFHRVDNISFDMNQNFSNVGEVSIVDPDDTILIHFTNEQDERYALH